jgi:hypothetical protein
MSASKNLARSMTLIFFTEILRETAMTYFYLPFLFYPFSSCLVILANIYLNFGAPPQMTERL